LNGLEVYIGSAEKLVIATEWLNVNNLKFAV